MNAHERDPMPRREGAGKRNLDLFLLGSKNSPICFYFEDEGCEELYARFLSRLFPGYLKPLVVCTGGKTKKQVLSDVDGHKLAPIVYVQDKDFDDIVGTLPSDPRIVLLNRYSFENYLVEPQALIEIAVESKRRLRREDAARSLAFDEYLEDLYRSYRPMAALFVVARRFNLKGIKTTKQSASDLFGRDNFIVDDAIVEGFKTNVAKAAFSAQRVSNEEQLLELLASALNPKVEYSHHADKHPNAHFCGKHILDLALTYVDSKVGTDLRNVDRFEIAMRILLHLSFTVFQRVREAIVSSLAQQKASAEVLKMMATA